MSLKNLCGGVIPLRLLFPALVWMLLVAACGPLLGWQAPTFAEVEKKIAALPLEQRVYERFLAWIAQVPAEQRGPRIKEIHIAYLTKNGFSGADVKEQLVVIDRAEARDKVGRWNRILTSATPTFNTKPNDFLVEMAKDLKPGTALDVGMGQGRNAIWLAQQGWEVTGFDPADEAVSLAEKNAAAAGVRVHTEVKGVGDFDFGNRRWDLILLSYVGGREWINRIQRALRPGGVLIIEAFHRDATRCSDRWGCGV